MDESVLEQLIKIKSIGELMMNQNENLPVEFSAGVINSLGRTLSEIVDKIIAESK